MRKRAMRDVFQRGNRSADVEPVTDSGGGDNIGADISNIRADINNSGADISNIRADINNSGADISNIRADVNNIGADISNSSADINNSGAGVNNSDADINNSGADNSTGGDTGTGNVVCRNQTVDEQLLPRIQTPGDQLTHTSDRRLAQLRLQGVTRRTNPASRSQSRGFVPHSNTNCSRIAGGSTSQ